MDSDIELGRIDGRVAPMLQTKRNIEEKGQDFKITDHIVYVEAAAYPFQKENTQLAQQVNESLQQLRESGKLQELSEQWFGMDATVDPRGYSQQEIKTVWSIAGKIRRDQTFLSVVNNNFV
mgnify:CR=1 FL=1